MHSIRGLHQIVNGLTYGDAISHHALKIRAMLQSLGLQSDIFAETVSDEFMGMARDIRLLPSMSGPGQGLIYHYSMYSQAHELLAKCTNPLVLVYHNITPSRYFVPYDARYTALLFRGREELARYRDRVVMALADSRYNCAELEQLGYSQTKVVPIIFDRSVYGGKPNQVIKKLFKDGYINILFVGRIVPQKKIEDLIKMFAFFRRKIDNRSRLIIVGEHRGFEAYFYSLLRLVQRLKLGEVHFTGMVPLNELRAFYQVADVFVSASEHEGFCVPLLESMNFGLPVIARACGAVPETLNGAGIMFHDPDPVIMAELVSRVVHDRGLRGLMKRLGQANLDRFVSGPDTSIFEQLLPLMEQWP